MYIKLRMSVQQEDYNHFGFPLRIPQKQTLVSAKADTGCQSCLAGLKINWSIHQRPHPCRPQDACSRQSRYTHLGRHQLRFSGINSKGEKTSTRQMVYVTDKTHKLFLSRVACTDLGIITHRFPTMEVTNPDNSIGAITTAPQGYIPSGDGYTRRYDNIISSIPNKTKCVDDTLLWSDTIEESFFQASN